MKTFLLLSVFLMPLLAFAHPGHGGHHGTDGYTITHYFSTPEHVFAALFALSVFIFVLFRFAVRNRKKTS